MLHLLTEEEFKLERTMGKMWRGDREPFTVKKAKEQAIQTLFGNPKWWHRDMCAWIMPSRYSWAVNLPTIKSLVDERLKDCGFTTLGDWGWNTFKGICSVCNKPVHEPYPDWRDWQTQSGVRHWNCGRQTDDIT